MPTPSPNKEEKTRSPPEDGTSSTLVIRGLPSSTTSSDVKTFFSSLAPIQSAFVVTKKTDSGIQCEGYGFVTFANRQDAVSFAQKSSLAWTDNTAVTLTYAKPRRRHVPDEGKPKHVQLSKDPSLPALRPRLIFRNLSWKIRKPEQLEKIVSPYGKAREVQIPRKTHARMTGFAFVEMMTRKAAGKVIEHVNGMNLDGRPVAVDWCVNKDEWMQHKQSTGEGTAREEDTVEEDEDELTEEEETDSEDDEDEEPGDEPPEPTSQTLFIRNIPYLVTRSTLFELFRPLGRIASLYLVTDPQTGLSRGTAFLTFTSSAPAEQILSLATRINDKTATSEEIERYTLEGRTLDFLPAVNRNEATRLKEEHATKKREDKRNLYLLGEGNIDQQHPFYPSLSTMDLTLRRDSMKQRKDMLASNPSLHLSLTRLAVRNIPRTMEESDLKKLALNAVSEFDKEVKNELRQGLTEEEMARNYPEVPKKLVRQVKIVEEKAGRSKGYGFIEYNCHSNALKGLRWLNARVVGERNVNADGDRKRRLLVEFAIENMQVVKRRKDREDANRRKAAAAKVAENDKRKATKDSVTTNSAKQGSGKRKWAGEDGMDKDNANKKRKAEEKADAVLKVKPGATDVGKIIGAKRYRRKLERGRKGK